MNKLKSLDARFQACTVTTKARTQANIPAGIHRVVENQTMGGGVSIAWAGSQIEIDYAEWTRLIDAGLVQDV